MRFLYPTSLFMLLSFLVGPHQALAALANEPGSPYFPAAYADFDFHAMYPPVDGYARSYGRCYSLLQDMRGYHEAFQATPEGRAVHDNALFRSVADKKVEWERAPCINIGVAPWADEYREQCADLTTRFDQDWTAFKASSTWQNALQADSLKKLLAGYRTFTNCMGW